MTTDPFDDHPPIRLPTEAEVFADRAIPRIPRTPGLRQPEGPLDAAAWARHAIGPPWVRHHNHLPGEDCTAVCRRNAMGIPTEPPPPPRTAPTYTDGDLVLVILSMLLLAAAVAYAVIGHT
jgi:hypothetical protein